MEAPALADIEAARARLEGVARTTPVYSSETFSRLAGRTVWLKAENLQRTGSFKIRGAYNTIASLSDDERRAGVVAASAGNHGQAVAWAAREAGIACTVFMPQDAPMAKVEATRGYGARVELAGEGFDESLEACNEHLLREGATFVHAFEDPRVIAGQGTIGLELAEQLSEAGTVLVPVGGGGLAAGISIALRARLPGARIVGVQAQPGFTIADGIAVKHPGELTMGILEQLLDDLVRVDDDEISEALLLCVERTKLLVEGAAVVGLAALLSGRAGGEGPALALLSGGNIDPTLLISVMRHGLTRSGRYLVVRTYIPDRPGALTKLLDLVAQLRGNVVAVEHHR
jgi:threonine dehydratase